MTDKQKVLIVDDTPANIKILSNLLRGKYKISIATNGFDALNLAKSENRPDLILLDINMPGMSGYEVCENLKADASTQDICIIFVTAKSDIEDEAKGFTFGAADYITKPFNPAIVQARVATHLDLKTKQDQLKSSISRMEHEAEIRDQKAELGLQAAGLAHDLNNILTTILYTRYLSQIIPDSVAEKAELEANVARIAESAELGCAICRGFTYYLRDIGEEARAQPIEPMLQALDIYAKSFSGTIVRDIATDLPFVKCKGYQLKRVYINMFVNAMQAFTTHKDQQINLRLWSDEGRVYFSMSDNGSGIPKAALPHIFEERFTTKRDGTGLGLFLVKQIVESHDGTINVKSVVGAGTTVTLSFPAVEYNG